MSGKAVLLREVRALQQVGLGGDGEAAAEEIEQGRLFRQARQAGVLPHEHPAAERAVAEGALSVGEVIEERLADDALAELLHLVVLELVGALG